MTAASPANMLPAKAAAISPTVSGDYIAKAFTIDTGYRTDGAAEIIDLSGSDNAKVVCEPVDRARGVLEKFYDWHLDLSKMQSLNEFQKAECAAKEIEATRTQVWSILKETINKNEAKARAAQQNFFDSLVTLSPTRGYEIPPRAISDDQWMATINKALDATRSQYGSDYQGAVLEAKLRRWALAMLEARNGRAVHVALTTEPIVFGITTEQNRRIVDYVWDRHDRKGASLFHAHIDATDRLKDATRVAMRWLELNEHEANMAATHRQEMERLEKGAQ